MWRQLCGVPVVARRLRVAGVAWGASGCALSSSRVSQELRQFSETEASAALNLAELLRSGVLQPRNLPAAPTALRHAMKLYVQAAALGRLHLVAVAGCVI